VIAKLCIVVGHGLPRFDINVSDRSLTKCITLAVQALGYEKAIEEQREAIKNFVIGRDVFVSLPTSLNTLAS